MKVYCLFIALSTLWITGVQAQANDSKITKARVLRDSDGALTTINIAQGRNTAKYEDGGLFNCHRQQMLSLDMILNSWPENVCDETQIRDFIWKHWSSKSRGYIRANYSGVDATATWHIFIEPGSSGKPSILARIVRSSALPGSQPDVLDLARITRVEKTHTPSNPENWQILLQNETGETVARFPIYEIRARLISR